MCGDPETVYTTIIPSLSVPQATNEEFKEEFAQAQRTSYGQTVGSDQTFLNDLGYDGLGGYGLGLQEDNDDDDPDGLEPFEVGNSISRWLFVR